MRNATRNSDEGPVQLVAVQTRITESEAEQLDVIAKRNFRSVAAELRAAITRLLDEDRERIAS